MVFGSHHIALEEMFDLAEGRTSEEDSQHLGSCAECAGQLARFNRAIALMRSDHSIDAPRDALFYAIQLFSQRAAETRPSVLQRIVAALTFDSLSAQPAFGVRSGAAAERQLLFKAGELDVDLRVTERGGEFVVFGQLLGECVGGRVQIVGAYFSTEASLNELCEFTLSPVPAGSYTLKLFLNESEIEIPGLELRT